MPASLGWAPSRSAPADLASNRKYCDRERLVAHRDEIPRWLEAFERNQLEISALIGHGAPLMPDRAIAQEYSRQFRQTCQLMEWAGIRRMTLLSGLPEGAEGDQHTGLGDLCRSALSAGHGGVAVGESA